jgi:hypothetical protein
VLKALALLAIPATILYFPYCIKEFPVFAHGNTPERMMSFFLLMGSVLLPVMWWSIAVWPVLVLGFGFARKLSPTTGTLLALSTAGLLMSTRSIFGGTLNQLTLVTVAAYPVWFILAPVLLERVFGRGMGRSWVAHKPLLLLISAYAVLRFGAAVVPELHSHYVSLDTAAGRIQISGTHAASSAAVYRYVLGHTTAGDRVADVAYGGAVNLATRHTSPLYSTQFSALAPAQRYLEMDLDRIRANPPKLIIAGESSYSATEYGICAETGCMFPQLVWRPTRLACDPGRVFPVIDFIKQNYEPVARFGDISVYAPRLRGDAGKAG